MPNARNIPIRIEVQGVQETITRLMSYAADVSIILQKVIEASGAKVIEETKRRCPVDTNRLRSSIGHPTDPDGIWQLNIVRHVLNLNVGTSVEYAWDVETIPRHHAVGQAHFMEEGATASISYIQNYFEQGLREAERRFL